MLEAPTQLICDCQNEVYDDKYTWKVIWSPPRWGKTIVAGWILYYLYDGDWDKVLQAFAFNLDDVMHRLENGLPCRVPTVNGLHNRVPGINWDDFGGHSNKAVTQHDESFDIFKGGFDVLGTQIGVLLTTMLDPAEATFQLANKYTHEIQITSPVEPGKPGTYKYDRIEWRQDFKANRIRPKKIWVETQEFDYWPKDVYRKYDAIRCSLSGEIFQRIRDKRRETELDRVLTLVKPVDIEVLRLIDARGPCNSTDARNHLPVDVLDSFDSNAIMRLNSRNLILPYKTDAGHYKHDISDLGKAVLDALDKAKGQIPSEGGSHVSVAEHSQIISAYRETKSQGAVASVLQRSPKTINEQIKLHNDSIKQVGMCKDCHDAKNKAEAQIMVFHRKSFLHEDKP